LHLPSLPVETFPALEKIDFCRHVFVQRIPGIDLAVDRAVALERLQKPHSMIQEQLAFSKPITAEQVHGNQIAVVNETTKCPVPGTDGLITNRPGLCLGIYVADCAAVYLIDFNHKAVGLVHSGKKGTELGIVPAAIHAMYSQFGTDPKDLIIQISPCIRPPAYEIDFAAEIRAQGNRNGVEQIYDCGTCTASDLNHYYSYRTEQGKTGRMLAWIEMKS